MDCVLAGPVPVAGCILLGVRSDRGGLWGNRHRRPLLHLRGETCRMQHVPRRDTNTVSVKRQRTCRPMYVGVASLKGVAFGRLDNGQNESVAHG